MKKASVFIMLLFVFFSVSLTQKKETTLGYESGNSLLEKLKEPPDTVNNTYSWGYVAGAWDAYALTMAIQPSEGMKKVTMLQVVDIAKKYLEENPEERHTLAAGLLRKAFDEAFPIEQNFQ